VNARERWQALQTTLTAARSAVERGDQAAALAAVNAALELDPNFLAAHSLRDRIVAGDLVTAPAPPAAAAPAPPPDAAAPAVNATPVATEGYAKFEQRARRRRVDRRIEAARQAIERKHLKHAAAALDEVIELDPNLPELLELTSQFDQLRRSSVVGHRGPWLVAAAVFGATVFGASWLQDSSPLFSRSIIGTAPLLAAPTTAVSIATADEPVATSGVMPAPPRAVNAAAIPQVAAPAEPPAAHTVMAAAAIARPVAEPIADLSTPPPAAPPAAPQAAPPPIVAPPRPVQDSAVGAPVTLPMPPKIESVDQSAMVRQTLQRYRSAYDGLDASSAHAVWPAVNQVALARAFEGLESQTLKFDACDVRVRGEAATATCQGSASYVPKIGNRQPRTEARTWNFTLHKAGDDWKIDSARAER
jgi:hypothetical protein